MDHPSISSQEPHYHCGAKYISSSAIVIAAICGVGISFLVNLLSVGLGLSLFTMNEKGLTTLAMGGFIWLVIIGILSMFVVGLIAGRIARSHNYIYNCRSGILHGFAAWSLTLILIFVFASHVHLLVGSSPLPDRDYQTVSTPTAVTNSSAGVNSTNNEPVSADTQTAHERNANIERTAKAIGITALATFIIFFLSALASCFGGYAGIKVTDNDSDVNLRRNVDNRKEEINRPTI